MVLPASADQMIFDAIKQTPKPFVIVCIWCPDGRQKSIDAAASGAIVSHGMCPACAARFESQMWER